ncbi:MAG: SRPBCC family protein [Pseudomonadota bacterium]|nr:SRPBCC family protein [Pseudomonadota bacterium]
MTNRLSGILILITFLATAFSAQADTFRSRVVTEIDIDKPIADVFDYATTAGNWKHWHPNTFNARGATDHSATENEEIIEILKLGFVVGPRLYWTVAEHTVPNKWRLLGKDRAGLINVELTYTFSMNEDGSTRFRRKMILDIPKDLLRNPINALVFIAYNRRTSAKALRQLKSVIEADPM